MVHRDSAPESLEQGIQSQSEGITRRNIFTDGI